MRPGYVPSRRRGLFSLGALVFASLVAGAACIVETDPTARRPLLRDTMRARAAAASSSASGLPVPPPAPEAFRTCDVDVDCVAVLPNGCCHDGRSLALNKGLVDAYRSTFQCPVASPVCPTHLVLDRRVATCDVNAHACILVEPAP